jgi:hypothetical protein
MDRVTIKNELERITDLYTPLIDLILSYVFCLNCGEFQTFRYGDRFCKVCLMMPHTEFLKVLRRLQLLLPWN